MAENCRSICGNKKALRLPEALVEENFAYIFAPRTASLHALATRNFTTFLAGILISCPVAGLRPMRALRLTSTNLPRPGRVKLFLAFLYARSAMNSRISPACFLVMPDLSATAVAICDLVRAFAILSIQCVGI